MKKTILILLTPVLIVLSPLSYAKHNMNLPFAYIASCIIDNDKTSNEPTPFRFYDVGDNIEIYTNLVPKDNKYSTQLLIHLDKNSYIINNITILEFNDYFDLSGIWQTASKGKREVIAHINKPINTFNLTVKRVLENNNNPDAPIPPEYEELNKLADRVFQCTYLDEL